MVAPAARYPIRHSVRLRRLARLASNCGRSERLALTYRGYVAHMTNEADNMHTADDADTPALGSDSTVDDWHGQEVARDFEVAEDALTIAEGDEHLAEAIFDDIRPNHPSDRFKVPAEEREATLVEPSDDESGR